MHAHEFNYSMYWSLCHSTSTTTTDSGLEKECSEDASHFAMGFEPPVKLQVVLFFLEMEMVIKRSAML